MVRQDPKERLPENRARRVECTRCSCRKQFVSGGPFSAMGCRKDGPMLLSPVSTHASL